jgi:putative oxidoreductase
MLMRTLAERRSMRIRERMDARMTARDGLEFILSMVLGMVFLRSAIPKLQHPKGFILTVLGYRMLPPSLSRTYARVVPPLELWLALIFLSGIAPRLAGIIAAMLLLSFMVGVSVNLIRGRDLDCGCFGKSKQKRIGWGLVVQDLALVGASAMLAALVQGWEGTAPWSILRFGSTSADTALIGLPASVAVTTSCAIILAGHARWGRRWTLPVAPR